MTDEDTKPDIKQPDPTKSGEFMLSKEEIYTALQVYAAKVYGMPDEGIKIAFKTHLDIHGVFQGFTIKFEEKEKIDDKRGKQDSASTTGSIDGSEG